MLQYITNPKLSLQNFPNIFLWKSGVNELLRLSLDLFSTMFGSFYLCEMYVVCYQFKAIIRPKTSYEYLVTVIGSGNVHVPFLNPTTSGLACSLQGARGSEGVYTVGVLASSQADHLITCVKLPACLWLGCCKGIYSSSHCHITTCDIGVIEKHDLFFGHNWLSIWIEIQLQFAFRISYVSPQLNCCNSCQLST